VSRASVAVLVCATIAGVGASAAPAAAQKVALSPTVGVYIPTSELIKAANGQEFKQEVGLSVGGRLGVDFSSRFGIVTSVAYVPSDLRFTFDQTQTQTDATLLLGTLRATVNVIPSTSPVWLSLNGGASLVKRGGTAYENAEDKSDIGGVVGATVGFNLGQFLSFYVAAEDYIYGTSFVESGTLEEKRTQNDVQLAVGFGVPLRK
jgi:Outer membrane protein beta-barrel domain